MITGTVKKAAQKLRLSYLRDTAGAIAVAFAVMAPVLVGATGMALDLGQSYLVRQRLSGALDAAALAATASEYEEEAIQARVDDFMEANYPEGKIGDLIIDSIDVSVDGDDVTVSASASYDTSFIRLLGIDYLNVAATTTIHRAIKGLEAVLVLDNTGSMGSTNMGYLKTAATNFVDILFDRAATPEDIRIGIVPYSSSVRIGFYGLGMIPDDGEFDDDGWDGTYAQYADGTVFVTLPAEVPYITYEAREDGGSADNGWAGCIVEHKESGYSGAATHVPGSVGQFWSTSATAGACTSSTNCRGHGWDPGSSSNDPYDDDTFDEYEGPWDIYMYGTIIEEGDECDDLSSSYDNDRCNACDGSGGNCTTEYCYCWHYDPTTSCPWAYVQPMISNEDALKAHIQTMKHEGGTYSNIGMAWGGRLISPEPPFEEGVDWDDPEWNKAIVMMTDGEMSPSSTYSTYWDSSNTQTDDITTLNNRLLEVCSDLKSKGVTIYTVNFKHASSNISDTTKQIYKDCATQPWQDYYRYVETGEELNEMFEEIAAALARLHISK